MKSVMMFITAYATQKTSVLVHLGSLIVLSQKAASGMHCDDISHSIPLTIDDEVYVKGKYIPGRQLP